MTMPYFPSIFSRRRDEAGQPQRNMPTPLLKILCRSSWEQSSMAIDACARRHGAARHHRREARRNITAGNGASHLRADGRAMQLSEAAWRRARRPHWRLCWTRSRRWNIIMKSSTRNWRVSLTDQSYGKRLFRSLKPSAEAELSGMDKWWNLSASTTTILPLAAISSLRGIFIDFADILSALFRGLLCCFKILIPCLCGNLNRSRDVIMLISEGLTTISSRGNACVI